MLFYNITVARLVVFVVIPLHTVHLNKIKWSSNNHPVEEDNSKRVDTSRNLRKSRFAWMGHTWFDRWSLEKLDSYHRDVRCKKSKASCAGGVYDTVSLTGTSGGGLFTMYGS
jgi:hypothetical protein